MTTNEIHEISIVDNYFKVIHGEDGSIYLSIRELCQFFKLDQEQQIQHLRQHVVFREGIGTNETEEMVIRADLLALWLANLNLKEIKVQIQDELIAYQREAALVLQEAWFQGRLTGRPNTAQLITSNSLLAKAYREAIVLVALVREQLFLEIQP